MADLMAFPDTVDEFMERYKITDTEQLYTNGIKLVPIYRMKQWFEHADFAPVVRCKNCVYAIPYNEKWTLPKKSNCLWCKMYEDSRTPGWYCADGERREENEPKGL